MAIEQVNLNFIKFFLEVPKSKSLGEISEKTGYETSTISINLSTFEKQLGVQLFTRNPLKLTEIGEEVYKKMEKAYREIEYATDIACKKNDINTGSISIGCPSHIANYYLAQIIKKAVNKYNNLTIELDCESPCKLMLNKIKENKLQFALLDYVPTDDEDENFEIEKIASSKYIFVAKEPIEINDMKELNTYRYIMSDDDYKSSSVEFIEYLKQFNVNIKPQIKCKTTEMRIEFCKLGLGIAYVIKDAVKDELENQELFEVKLPKNIVFPNNSINIVYIKGRLTKADKQFINEYLRTAKK